MPRPRKKTTRSTVAAAQLRIGRASRSRPGRAPTASGKYKIKIQQTSGARRRLHPPRQGPGHAALARDARRPARPPRPGHSKAMWQLFGDAPPPATDADRPHLTKRLHKKYYVVVDD